MAIETIDRCWTNFLLMGDHCNIDTLLVKIDKITQTPSYGVVLNRIVIKTPHEQLRSRVIGCDDHKDAVLVEVDIDTDVFWYTWNPSPVNGAIRADHRDA